MIEPNTVFASLIKNPIVSNGLDWKIPADLPYFDGHFPGTPVFPAVGIVDASIVVLRHVLDAPQLEFRSVETAKFLNLIIPGTEVRVEWNLETDSSEQKSYTVNWIKSSNQEVLATVSLLVV